MSTIKGQLRDRKVNSRLPPSLDRRFEAVVFDWDGTAVPDRGADASELRALVEELCALGLDLIVITGTHVGNVDGQLGARPAGPGRLYFCVNRGSEVYAANPDGLELVDRPAGDAGGGRGARRGCRGDRRRARRAAVSRAAVVSQRLNRRKIDLIPEPEWADPPKARIGELLAAVQERLRGAGLTGLGDAVEIALAAARAAGLADPRVTSDAKHVEIGLTDKADSARWAFAELGRRGIGPGLVLIAGDEFGPLGGTARQRLLPARPGGGTGDGGVGRRGAERHARGGARARRRAGRLPPAAGGPARAAPPRRRPRTRRRSRLDARRRRARPAAGARARVAPDARRRAARDARRAALRPRGHGAGRPVLRRLRRRRLRHRAGRVPRLDAPLPRSAHGRPRITRRLDLATGLLREEGPAHLASLLVARAARHRGASRAGEPRCGRGSPPAPRARRPSRPRFGIGATATSSSASAPTTRRQAVAQAGARRRAGRRASNGCCASTGRRGRSAGRRPTSSSRATRSCSGRFASRSST